MTTARIPIHSYLEAPVYLVRINLLIELAQDRSISLV